MSECKQAILVLGGGPDAEHAVSLASAAAVASALRKAGHEVTEVTIDRPTPSELAAMPGEVVFGVLHGPWGEGGGLQRLLERDGRPFVGSGERASRLAMDKLATKLVAAKLGVPTPAACLLNGAMNGDDARCALEPPVVIKPVFEGSSVGLHLCADRASLTAALGSLETRDGSWMAEAMVAGRELTVGVMDRGHGVLEAMPVIEIRPRGGTYDYGAKYERDDTQYVVSPELPPGVAAVLSEHAIKAANAVGVRHLARVDFMLDAHFVGWMLEVNTMPGFTSHSLFPMAASGMGISMAELATGLVACAAADGTMKSQRATANKGV